MKWHPILLLLLLILTQTACVSKQTLINQNGKMSKLEKIRLDLETTYVIRSKDTEKTTSRYQVEAGMLYYQMNTFGRHRSKTELSIPLDSTDLSRLERVVKYDQGILFGELVLPDIKGTHFDTHVEQIIRISSDQQECKAYVKGMKSQLRKEMVYLTISTLEEYLEKKVLMVQMNQQGKTLEKK